MKAQCIVMAAGGSGGHLLPAQALARRLSQAGYDVVFIGVGLKNNPFFQKCSMVFHDVSGASFSSKEFWKAPFRILSGIIKSLKLLIKLRPTAVVGFGSYHSFPPQAAAWLLRVPLLLFEPNLELGKVNHLFFRYAKRCMSYFIADHQKVTRIHPMTCYQRFDPVEAKKRLEINSPLPILVVMGGSQGSMIINRCVQKIDPALLKHFFIIHLCGTEVEREILQKFYQEHHLPAMIQPFSHQMELILSCADIMISRCGASALMEAMIYCLPTLFIPYGSDQQGHQHANARYFVEHLKGGMMIQQEEIGNKNFPDAIEELIKNRKVLHANLSAHQHTPKACVMDVIAQEIKS